MDKLVHSFILGLVVVFLSMYLWHSVTRTHRDPILDDVDVPDILEEHTDEFRNPEIIKVTEGVYVAIGFALANSIMLEGPDGLVIVDTTESAEAAQEILQEFRNITDKPIRAIVATHNHLDHTRGIETFIEEPENPPLVIAHELLPPQIERYVNTGLRIYRGGAHQFGSEVNYNMEAIRNAGIGIKLRLNHGVFHSSYPPNFLVDGNYNEMEIAGLKLVFIHIPGETPDQLGVWLPDKKILLPADDIYKTFPNLYAIRGTPPRDVLVWAESLQKMIDLHPECLVPSHTRPLYGREEIESTLSVYRDAILYIHDQTVRHMNTGMHPDDITKLVKLPPSLAQHRYLLEFYGTVEWSVKSVYNQYIGWFSGDVVDLHPMAPKDEAKKMVKLVGAAHLLQAARNALHSNDLQWALKLVSYVFRARPDDVEALALRLEILRELASKETSANGRHYYLLTAYDDHKLMDWRVDISHILDNAKLSTLINTLKVRFKGEEAVGVDKKVIFHFTDINETYLLWIQNCVLHVSEVDTIPEQVDLRLTTTSDIYRGLIKNTVNPLFSYMSGDINIDGSLWQFKKFMDYFERPNQ